MDTQMFNEAVSQIKYLIQKRGYNYYKYNFSSKSSSDILVKSKTKDFVINLNGFTFEDIKTQSKEWCIHKTKVLNRVVGPSKNIIIGYEMPGIEHIDYSDED